MLKSGFQPEIDRTITMEDISKAREMVKEVEINDGMFDIILKLRKKLYDQGIKVTDRTFKTSTKILRAEAFLNGRNSVEESDFDVLSHVYWRDPDHYKKVYTSILELVAPERGKIVELYEKAKETAFQALNEKDENKKSEKAIDSASKLKEAKKEMGKLIEQMDKKNAKKPEIKEVTKMRDDLNKLIARVFEEGCGIDLGVE